VPYRDDTNRFMGISAVVDKSKKPLVHISLPHVAVTLRISRFFSFPSFSSTLAILISTKVPPIPRETENLSVGTTSPFKRPETWQSKGFGASENSGNLR